MLWVIDWQYLSVFGRILWKKYIKDFVCCEFYQIDRSPSSSRSKTIGFWAGAEPLLYSNNIQIQWKLSECTWIFLARQLCNFKLYNYILSLQNVLSIYQTKIQLYHWIKHLLSNFMQHIITDQLNLPAIQLTDLHSIWKLPRAWLPWWGEKGIGNWY